MTRLRTIEARFIVSEQRLTDEQSELDNVEAFRVLESSDNRVKIWVVFCRSLFAGETKFLRPENLYVGPVKDRWARLLQAAALNEDQRRR